MKKLFAVLTCAFLIFGMTACAGANLGNGFGLLTSKSSENLYGSSTQPTNSNGTSTPGTSIQTPGTSVQTPGTSQQTPGTSQQTPGTSVQTPGTSQQTPPASSQQTPASSSEQPTGEVSSDIKPLSYAGLSESAYVTWNETTIGSAAAYYKLSNSTSYTKVDQELIRADGSGKARVDMLGLKAGTYDLRVHVGGQNKDIEIKNVSIAAYDRSGYAHFNYNTGVGAYENDGTLKSNVKVYYVTEANKNNVGGNGFVALLKGGNVCLRFVGRVCADAWKASSSSTSSKEGKYTQIKGISDRTIGKFKSKSSPKGDSYFNMVDVSASNITVEGVGIDAEAFQWGITFKNCKNIEVRNMTFTDYPEDACAFEAGQSSSAKSPTHGWVHNCVFNKGKNLWDWTGEQDKGEGDGATDVKKTSYMTYSYNVYNECHKTGLVGGDDDHYQSDITMHHNYYYKTYSRTPLARQANIHMYNNFFNNCGDYCVSLRANCYLFSESNYILGCTFRDKKEGGACKSYNDVFSGATKGSINVVTDRNATVSNSCSYGNKFDTDSTRFYYANGKTNVSYLSTAEQAKADCVSNAGICKANKFN